MRLLADEKFPGDAVTALQARGHTKPMLESILSELRAFRQDTQKRFVALEIRLDRMNSEIKATHAELYELRADFVRVSRAL